MEVKPKGIDNMKIGIHGTIIKEHRGQKGERVIDEMKLDGIGIVRGRFYISDPITSMDFVDLEVGFSKKY